MELALKDGECADMLAKGCEPVAPAKDADKEGGVCKILDIVTSCLIEFFVLYGDVWWLHEVFVRNGFRKGMFSSGGVQQAAVEEIKFIQSQFAEQKSIKYDKDNFVEDRHTPGKMFHWIVGWYGNCVSFTLNSIDEHPKFYKYGMSVIGVVLFLWTVIGLIFSVPEPRDLGTFHVVEHSPLLKIVLVACTHAIFVVFARTQQVTLKAKALRSMDSSGHTMPLDLEDEEREHLQYPCLLPFIVGKFFLIARMALAYSNHDMGIAIDYFVYQETILIAVHALIAMIGVPLLEKWFQGACRVSFMEKMQARFWSVLLADSVKTGIMFIFYFEIFTPGLISHRFNRLPHQYTQIAVAVFVHAVLDAAQSLVTFFMFYIGEFGRKLTAGTQNQDAQY